jgi:hypothetical protein
MKLTQKSTAVLKLPHGKTEKFFWDDELKGFALRLRNEGGQLHQTYIAQYRIKGRQRRLKIGDHAKITEKQARDEAKKMFARVALGKDPAAEKEKERASAARTLRVIIDDYLAMKESTLRAASYRVTRIYCKMLNISAKETPKDVTQLSDQELIATLAQQARKLLRTGASISPKLTQRCVYDI